MNLNYNLIIPSTFNQELRTKLMEMLSDRAKTSTLYEHKWTRAPHCSCKPSKDYSNVMASGLSHSAPNDDTLSGKVAHSLTEAAFRKAGKMSIILSMVSVTVMHWPSFWKLCFHPIECIIKSISNPRNVTKMASTFGTWMQDTALQDDEHIWVAEHFSGTFLQSLIFSPCLHVCQTMCGTSCVMWLVAWFTSGRMVKEYKSIAALQNNTSNPVDLKKYFQGCGHILHNGSIYYHVAGTSKIAR